MARAIGIFNGNSRNSQYMRELQEESDRAEYRRRLEKLHAEDRAVYFELLEVDPEGGEAWYDNDDNVPAFGSTRERIRIVRAHIEELKVQRGEVSDDQEN